MLLNKTKHVRTHDFTVIDIKEILEQNLNVSRYTSMKIQLHTLIVYQIRLQGLQLQIRSVTMNFRQALCLLVLTDQ